MKKLIIAVCMLAAVTVFMPVKNVKAATYDKYTCDQIVKNFWNYDQYQQDLAQKTQTLMNLMSSGASASRIRAAATAQASAAANFTYVNSRVNNILNDPAYLANPSQYVSSLIPPNPSLLNEPTDWALLTNKQKYRDAWQRQSYANSQLVNQAAYNGDIAAIGAYAEEQGNIAAWNEYWKGQPRP